MNRGARQFKPISVERSIEVPRWVPPRLELDYLAIAERDGEEKAASVIRRRKRAMLAAAALENGAAR